MPHEYPGVHTRFLRPEERLFLTEERDLPLVLEAKENNDLPFLQALLKTHSAEILADMAQYGAVLLRGFDIQSDQDFEKTVLSIKELRGISDAFMSEQGRIHVGDLKYVLHTNAVYKTGGTLYLGGFHSENYYSPDVPAYIFFCCLKPSRLGGETGLINMEKVYRHLNPELKAKLEAKNFFVSKWLMSEVSERYKLAPASIEKICKKFDLPVIGTDSDKFILMYKPSIFEHPLTKLKSLQINLFELPTLNAALRKVFRKDYQGKTWFWHRLVWNLPHFAFKALEHIYVTFASLFYSPRESFKILRAKLNTAKASKKKQNLPPFNSTKVGNCFEEKDVKKLAQLMRDYYSSCLWQKGDLLMVDNRLVAHAGMPGSGPRLIRAMICNPMDMKYSNPQSGLLECKYRQIETLGHYMSQGNRLVPASKANDPAPAEEIES